MSPPIRDGSGNSIGSIRLGDGSEISEVRTGAGDVLFAASPDVIERFESANPLSNYNGATGGMSITQTNVIDGSNALQFDSTGTDEAIYSSSGLSFFPSKGDIISVLLRDTTDRNVPTFAYGMVGSTSTDFDCYGLAHDGTQTASDGNVTIRRYDNGSFTGIASDQSVTLSPGEWYDYELEWHDGTGSEPDNTHKLTVHEVDESAFAFNTAPSNYRLGTVTTISTQDSTYSSQTGIGWINGFNNTSIAVADSARRVDEV